MKPTKKPTPVVTAQPPQEMPPRIVLEFTPDGHSIPGTPVVATVPLGDGRTLSCRGIVLRYDHDSQLLPTRLELLIDESRIE